MEKEIEMDEGYVRLCFSASDFEKVNEIFENRFDQEDLPEGRWEGSLSLELDEAYMGLEEERKKLKEMGIPFEGFTDPFNDRDCTVFASIDGVEVKCDSTLEKRPMAAVYEDGSVDSDGLGRAQMYYRLIGKIEEYILGKIPT